MTDQQWFDILSSEAQKHIVALEAIVRDLAAHEPPYWEGPCGDGAGCLFCDLSTKSWGIDPLDIPERHEPSCPWRRARELYPQVTP